MDHLETRHKTGHIFQPIKQAVECSTCDPRKIEDSLRSAQGLWSLVHFYCSTIDWRTQSLVWCSADTQYFITIICMYILSISIFQMSPLQIGLAVRLSLAEIMTIRAGLFRILRSGMSSHIWIEASMAFLPSLVSRCDVPVSCKTA